jgi:hypothetical protein
MVLELHVHAQDESSLEGSYGYQLEMVELSEVSRSPYLYNLSQYDILHPS